jgi:arylsulfatase A-like enzyme
MKRIVLNILCGIAALTITQLKAATLINDRDNFSRPNVILVITDDQGYGDMSCHGHPFLQTPNIDALHKESIRFTNFHVDPTCAPTRAALLTGKYSTRVGVWHTLQGRSILNKDEITLAQVFSENGYKTGLFGKWHLGDNYPYHPWNRGFDEVLMFSGGGVGQNPDYWRNTYFSDIYLRNGNYEFHEGYCTDVWFNNAIEFMKENHPRKTGNPFFSVIATNAPHYPYFVADHYTIPFRDLGMDDQLARYLGMVVNIDENLGKLVKEIDELGLRENTILIFMTDNGLSTPKLPRSGPFYYNAGMRGLKGSAYEGGHRVPFFIRWPYGGIKGGKDISTLTAQFDLMPTLIDLCGLENKHPIDFDGISFVPLLKGDDSNWPERTLFVHNQRVNTPVKWRNCVVMNRQYRLINGQELYDIKKDPGQENDIAGLYPAVLEELRTSYDVWWEDMSESFDKYNRLYIGSDKENPTRITCHDWFSEEPLRVFDQETIRQREHTNGFWAVHVVEDGEYEFTCRTFPIEEDTGLQVSKVRLKIGDKELEKEVNHPGSSEVKLRMKLTKGDAFMQTWFYEKDGNNYGVPYLYIKRL